MRPRTVLLVPILLAGLAAPAQQQAVVEQPRPFGYTVGDLATQRVLLPEGFAPAALPEAGRASVWLERRPARYERRADGSRWLAVDYQVVNAAPALASVAVPGWQLAGPVATRALQVPATAITVGPLTAPAAPGQAVPLRPDRPAPAVATAAMRRQLWLWLAALAVTLAAWVAYTAWSAWHARRTLPFTRALHELRGRDTPLAAHVALHQAFDRTAGRVVQAGSLAALFERAPHLRPLQPQIERFYAESAALFFGGGLPADALSPHSLCRRLARLERQSAP